jgi:uncharacterized repeat protein (TIGR01451 family)
MLFRRLLFLVLALLSFQTQAGTCFAIDDDTGVIITYDSDPPFNLRFTTTIQLTPNTEQFESAYFDSVTNRYYVVRQSAPNVFGYIRPNDGVFVPVGTGLGTANVPAAFGGGTRTPSGAGASGIRGLARNPVDNKWYVSDQLGYIYELNPTTGNIVLGSFSGRDTIRASDPAGAFYNNVEDLTFDNAGNLHMVRNPAGANQFFKNVNLVSGVAAAGFNLGIGEAEGLSNSLGDIRIITGAFGAPAGRFSSIDLNTGALTTLFTVPATVSPTVPDFEATGCNDGVSRADLKLTKTVSPASVAPGGTALFSLRIEHEGIDRAYRIQVTDTLPPGMTVLSSSIGPGCGVCSFDIPSGVWDIGVMDIGQVRTVNLVISTGSAPPNSFQINRAQITRSCDSPTGPCVPLLDVDSTPNNKLGAWSPTEDDEAVAGLIISAAPSVNKSFSPTSGLAGQTTTLILTLSNPSTATVATLTAAFTDVYPVGMANAALPAVATTCGNAAAGAPTAAAGGSSVSLPAGRVIPLNGACSVSVVVTAASVGDYTNTVTTNAITATIAGVTVTNLVGATAVYQVTPDNIGVIKDFTPEGIGAGQSSTLTLILSNPRNVTASLTSLLTDVYPSNLVNAAVPNPQTTCAGGTAAATAGSNSVTLSIGAQIPPNGSCRITVNVTSSINAVYTNTIPPGSVSTSVGGNLGTTSAVLIVDNPSVSKQFIPSSILPGGVSQLRLTFFNPRTTAATFSANFVDILPNIGASNMVVAPTPGITNSCGAVAAVTAPSGSNRITLTTANTIPAVASCIVNVNVTVNPTTATGTFVNTIPAGSLSTSLGNNTTATSATLLVSSQTNLSVTKVVSRANVFPGTTLTYTVTVSNFGPDTAFGAVWSDVLSGVNMFGAVTPTLSAGASVVTTATSSSQITATMNIPNGGNISFSFQGVPSLSNGFVTNTASVRAGLTSTDSVLANNTVSVNTAISPSSFLSITKTNGTITVPAGGTTVYTVTFTNTGPSDASGALARDFPSSNLINCAVQSCSVTGGALCGSPTFTALNTSGFSLPGFPSGSSITMLISCQVNGLGL